MAAAFAVYKLFIKTARKVRGKHTTTLTALAVSEQLSGGGFFRDIFSQMYSFADGGDARIH